MREVALLARQREELRSCANRGPVSRSRPNLETGIPSRFPGQIGNRGDGNWGFPGLGHYHQLEPPGMLLVVDFGKAAFLIWKQA